jgi:hypothetical protein
LPVIDNSITPMFDVGDRPNGKAPGGGWDAVVHPKADARIGNARRAGSEEVRGQAAIQRQPQAQVQVQAQTPAVVPRKRVNTRNFAFWPQTGDRYAPLPPYVLMKDRGENEEDEVEETVQEEKNRIVVDLARFGTLQEPGDDEDM